MATVEMETGVGSRQSIDPTCSLVRAEVCVTIPSSVWTLDGFLAWLWSEQFPENCHASFIGSEVIIDMSPENYELHNAVKLSLYMTLGSLVRRANIGRFVVDNMQLVNKPCDVSTEPDGAFVAWDSLKSGKARFTANIHDTPMMELHGTPDWVAEIVSPSSVRKDTVLLRDAYHRVGIPEYWLIDVRGSDVIFEILRHTPDGYVAVKGQDGWLTSTVFGRRFRLERFRDQAGLWDYTLHIDPA